jgi:uncharacterized glyoxalase superfamily protein PhnB
MAVHEGREQGKSMTITRAAPVLLVDDVAKTSAFYRNVLGFAFVVGVTEAGRETVVAWPPPGPLAFAMVESGQARIMFETRAAMAADLPRFAETRRGGSIILYLECDDLDALYERLSEHAPFLKAPHTTFYGTRECSIEDPNGYVLTFAKRLDNTPPTPETAP